MDNVVIYNAGGTIETTVLDYRPDSATVQVLDGAGATKVPAGTVATLDPVNTTLSSSASAGATSVAVTSAANIVIGRRYWIGGWTVERESITVASVSGTTVTLRRPLRNAHALGEAFIGTRLSYTITAAQANALWWDGRAIWTPVLAAPAEGQRAAESIVEVVHCARVKIPEALASTVDLGLVVPRLRHVLDEEVDLPLSLMEARRALLQDLGGKWRVYTTIASLELVIPHAMRWWLDRRYGFSSDEQPVFDRLEAEYLRRIAQLQALVVVDQDQDQAIDAAEGPYTTGRVWRA